MSKKVKLNDFVELLKKIENSTVGKMFLEFKKHFGIMIPTIRTGNTCILTKSSVVITKEEYFKLLDCIQCEIQLLKSFLENKTTIKMIFFRQLKSGDVK